MLDNAVRCRDQNVFAAFTPEQIQAHLDQACERARVRGMNFHVDIDDPYRRTVVCQPPIVRPITPEVMSVMVEEVKERFPHFCSMASNYVKIEPNGASLKATRVGDRTEFFRSSDEWSRPVNFTTGPDGAIYICDIYRRWIDHARFFPEEFVKNHDMRQGENHGRIWRVVPKKSGSVVSTDLKAAVTAASPSASPEKIEDLVAWLGHENAWQRETAQRLLIEHFSRALAGHALEDFKDESKAKLALQVLKPLFDAIPSSINEMFVIHFATVCRAVANNTNVIFEKVPKDKLEAIIKVFEKSDAAFEMRLWTAAAGGPQLGMMHLLKARNSISPSEHRFRFLTLCATALKGPLPEILSYEMVHLRESDPWNLKALTIGQAKCSTFLSRYFFSTPVSAAEMTPGRFEIIKTLLASSISNLQDDELLYELRRCLNSLANEPETVAWYRLAIISGLSEGLPKSNGKLGVKSLAEFMTKPPQGFEQDAKNIAYLFGKIDAIIADSKAPLDQRLAVLPLLASRKWAAV
jgi:hypothetical protein